LIGRAQDIVAELEPTSSVVIHPAYMPTSRTALALAVGRSLLAPRGDVGLVGPVVTSAWSIPFDVREDWRGIPHRVQLLVEGGTSVERTVWELMSPAQYAAWLAVDCP
jgi:hypothetical protein